ncbi:MAG: hypothetical protein U7126_12655 [Microcoleus sp.]
MFLVRAIALRMWKFNRGAIAFQVAGLLENSAVLPVAAMRVCGSWLEGRSPFGCGNLIGGRSPFRWRDC